MTLPRLTVEEYMEMRASWPRGLFGPIVPEEYRAGVLIVSDAERVADLAPETLTARHRARGADEC